MSGVIVNLHLSIKLLRYIVAFAEQYLFLLNVSKDRAG